MKRQKRRRILDAKVQTPKELTQERGPQIERPTLTWTLGEVVRRQAAEVLAKLETT